jgi:hypothetical protein
MQVGQQVVCVDDRFPTPLAKYYVNLPVKGKTYTVRAVFVGRKVMHPHAGNVDTEVGLLLRELVNGKDPRNKYLQELGFNSDRFRPLRHFDSQLANEHEMVRVRVARKTEPLKEMSMPSSPKWL